MFAQLTEPVTVTTRSRLRCALAVIGTIAAWLAMRSDQPNRPLSPLPPDAMTYPYLNIHELDGRFTLTLIDTDAETYQT
jgi:hypothetical protein